MSGVVCGLPLDGYSDPDTEAGLVVGCDHALNRTYGPAGSLWCPVHGHVFDVLAQPPLTGVVHLNFGDVKQNGWASIEAIEAGLV